MADELNWLSAAKLVKAYKQKTLSPVEVVRASLDQIARHDSKLNAMCLVDETKALKQAKASEGRWHKRKPLGAVDGVPALVKDLILVKGWPTLRGSKTIDRNQAWDQDGPSVARLRETGAVLLGLTTTPEFGWKGVTDSPLTGITRNPWDLTKTPGRLFGRLLRRGRRRAMRLWRSAPMAAARSAFRPASPASSVSNRHSAACRHGRSRPLARLLISGR